MSGKSIHELISDSFSPSDKENWIAAAMQEIDGKNPNEALAWTSDGMAFLSYYDKNDVARLHNQNNFQLSPSTDLFSGPRTWVNLPCIIVSDEKEANANALSQLSAGADGILFDVRNHANINFDLLLDQIDWPFCSISFRTNSDHPISESLSLYIQRKDYTPASLKGCIFWDDDLQKKNLSVSSLSSCTTFRSCGLIIPASTPVKEISDALVKGVHLVDHLTENGIDVSTAIQQMAFSIPVSSNFFLEIAKLKALRALWFQVARAYAEESYQPSQLHLHVRSDVWTNANYQPNANLLRSTTASLAAVLGGCNSLTVYAEGERFMMNRIARNISSVLREESYIDKVADPTSGAYALEKMTDEIAQASWLDFQQQIKES